MARRLLELEMDGWNLNSKIFIHWFLGDLYAILEMHTFLLLIGIVRYSYHNAFR